MKNIEIPEYIPYGFRMDYNSQSQQMNIFFGVDRHPFVPNLYLDYPLKFSCGTYEHLECLFEFDPDPFCGQEDLVDLSDIGSTSNYEEMSFSIYVGSDDLYHFRIKSAYHYITVMQRTIVEVNQKKQKIEFTEADLDRVGITFEKDKLIELRVYGRRYEGVKNKNFVITLEKNEYTLILLHHPERRRVKLNSFSVRNHEIHCFYGEGDFCFVLDVNDHIYKIIEELLNIEGAMDFDKP